LPKNVINHVVLHQFDMTIAELPYFRESVIKIPMALCNQHDPVLSDVILNGSISGNHYVSLRGIAATALLDGS
jgi:hypothetical protein